MSLIETQINEGWSLYHLLVVCKYRNNKLIMKKHVQYGEYRTERVVIIVNEALMYIFFL